MNAVQRRPGRYTDRHGSEDVVFESDGRQLIRTTIRGVHFESYSMNDLRALDGEPPEASFTISDGALCSCLLEWEVPLSVAVEGQGVRATVLDCALRLGGPVGPLRGLDVEILTTTLRLDGREYRNNEGGDNFEDALHEIQRRLPAGVRLWACTACARSDYLPVGHGLMGGLGCFRDARPGPDGVLDAWNEHTEFVQETWLCEQFEHRATTRHTGHRGPFPSHPRQ
ncbi:DUF6304 family protein [Streptomyces sp. STR69]|uniref:DUF6304 family protein n=1 Tax=Streptomyces sp. STR69 TaxID=1796942 RepID=UPI0021C570AA|nr:DUF6304 family protein [Streptomyces sp. STR69]